MATTERQNPAPGATGNGANEHGQALTVKNTTRRTPPRGFWTKRRRVLLNLTRRSLHRFQAERIGEHCLHSTIAALQAEGIEFARETIAVPGWGGQKSHVCRYWLTDIEREKAIQRLSADLVAAGMAGSVEEARRFLEAGER